VNAYIYACLNFYIHIYINTYEYVLICIYTLTNLCLYVYKSTHKFMCTCHVSNFEWNKTCNFFAHKRCTGKYTDLPIPFIDCANVCVCVYWYICVCVHVCVYKCIFYVFMCIWMYVCIQVLRVKSLHHHLIAQEKGCVFEVYTWCQKIPIYMWKQTFQACFYSICTFIHE